MKITFNTDAMTVVADGIDPIDVKDVAEAIQVVEAMASEMDSQELEMPADEEMTDDMMEAEAIEKTFDGKRIPKRGMEEV